MNVKQKLFFTLKYSEEKQTNKKQYSTLKALALNLEDDLCMIRNFTALHVTLRDNSPPKVPEPYVIK